MVTQQTTNSYSRAHARPTSGLEVKNIDLRIVNNSVLGDEHTVVIPRGGFIVPTLVGIAEGTNASARLGRKATALSWHLRGRMRNEDDQDVAFRFIVYLDKQPCGAAATPADILHIWPQADHVEITGMRELNNTGRFVILADKTKVVKAIPPTAVFNSSTGSVVSQDYKNEVVFKMDGKTKTTVHYGGTTADIANIRTNNIGVLIVQDNGKALGESQDSWLSGFCARTRFVG